MVKLPEWGEIQAALTAADGSVPVARRYRCLFSAKQQAPSGEELLALLQRCLGTERSVLLRHEVAYVIGQSRGAEAVPLLQRMLHDPTEDEVTRHEAAEALAAIVTAADPAPSGELAAAVDADLARYTAPGAPVLLEHTCILAREGVARAGGSDSLPPCACVEAGADYSSRDPAKGLRGKTADDVPQLAALLADGAAGLYDRYEAMFTLRNLGGEAAVTALCAALAADSSSAILRHEIAFVLGQMEHPSATQALISKLRETTEHDVVRHEAAIALGAVGTEEAEAALQQHRADPSLFVAESCEAALASLAYWREWEELERRIREQD